MARIRNIKPDFFIDEDLAEVSFEARIFFAGLWCHADRDGRLEYRPKKLKAMIMPYDTVDVEAICSTLAAPCIPHRPDKVFILIYEHAGEKYIEIPNLAKHQKFHKDEKSKHLPSPTDQQGASRVPAGCQQGASRPDSGNLKSENGDGAGPEASSLDADKINSDTPLPPILQHEWDRLLEVYPKPHLGKDKAIRIFVRSAERARILRAASHFAASDMARAGKVFALDRFVAGGFRDFDESQPLGTGPPGSSPDDSWKRDSLQAQAVADAARAKGYRPPKMQETGAGSQ